MCKKFVLILTVFLFFNFVSIHPVKADYNSAYLNYVSNQQQYKSAHGAYQIAKSSYQTYGTLTAENDAISKLKAVLKARDNLMASYFDLLQEKMNVTEGVSGEAKSTFSGLSSSEKSWLSAHQTQIDAAAGLEDLNDVSQEFETRFSQMDQETKGAIGKVLLAKENVLRGKLDVALNQSTARLNEIRNRGENTEIADRGIISIQNKLTFQDQKTAQAQAIFEGTGQNNRRQAINLLSGQKALIEANQYLKEASTYLLEIIRSYTG